MADPVGTISSSVKYVWAARQLIRKYYKIDDDLKQALNKLKSHQEELEAICKAIADDPSLAYTVDMARESLLAAEKAAKSWAKKLGKPLPDDMHRTTSSPQAVDLPPVDPSTVDSTLSEQVVECLALGPTTGKQGAVMRTHALAWLRRTLQIIQRKLVLQFHKAVFLSEGKEELYNLLKACEDVAATINRACLPQLANPEYRLPQAFNLRTHSSIAYIMRARQRAADNVAIRRTLTFEANFKGSDILSQDGLVVPLQEKGEAYLLLDRERKPEDGSERAKARAVEASERFVRLFQLDEKEDHEEFRRYTGLLSCSALVNHSDEKNWEAQHRKKWEELHQQDENAWKLPLDQRPPTPPSPRRSILFILPSHMDAPPTMLRKMLDDSRVSGQKPFPVNRIRFACALAESMIALHAMGLVHKGIRPDNLLVIKEAGGMDNFKSQIGMPYLVGFDQVRGEEQESGKRNYFTNELRRNVYTDPTFFRARLRKYEMLDDIYSFGVTLIEILMWQSFFKYNPDDASWQLDKDVLDIDECSHNKWTDAFKRKAEDLKQVSHALVDIVQLCLRAWDTSKDKKAHGIVIGERGEFTPSLQAALGVKFLVLVLGELRKLESSNTKRLDDAFL